MILLNLRIAKPVYFVESLRMVGFAPALPTLRLTIFNLCITMNAERGNQKYDLFLLNNQQRNII